MWVGQSEQGLLALSEGGQVSRGSRARRADSVKGWTIGMLKVFEQRSGVT